MLAVGERVPVVVDVVVGEFDGGAGGALPRDDGCELPGEAEGELGGLGWGGGVDRDRRVEGGNEKAREGTGVCVRGWGGAVKWGDREWEIKEYRPSDMVE